jgi:hypothetical protein
VIDEVEEEEVADDEIDRVKFIALFVCLFALFDIMQ